MNYPLVRVLSFVFALVDPQFQCSYRSYVCRVSQSLVNALIHMPLVGYHREDSEKLEIVIIYDPFLSPNRYVQGFYTFSNAI